MSYINLDPLLDEQIDSAYQIYSGELFVVIITKTVHFTISVTDHLLQVIGSRWVFHDDAWLLNEQERGKVTCEMNEEVISIYSESGQKFLRMYRKLSKDDIFKFKSPLQIRQIGYRLYCYPTNLCELTYPSSRIYSSVLAKFVTSLQLFNQRWLARLTKDITTFISYLVWVLVEQNISGYCKPRS